MNSNEKTLLTKISTKLDSMDKKLDGHLSEHFKMRLVIYAAFGTLIVGLLVQ